MTKHRTCWSTHLIDIYITQTILISFINFLVSDVFFVSILSTIHVFNLTFAVLNARLQFTHKCMRACVNIKSLIGK